MVKPDIRRVRAILRGLQVSSSDVEGSALVSFDGLVIASELELHVDADRFGAMCASLVSLAVRAAREVDRGELRQLIVDGVNGPMLLTRAGDRGVLALAARPSASLGRLILDSRKAVLSIEEAFVPADGF
ncbi:roadblock/LC7 domain-containing protein [Ideonella sp. YS5]|uniref:roadblock/LC7 domain-containing protein n=1 Tax=Ideonella sp. YS5 TaxID=3453714 RepID=UPI003EEED15F